LLPLSFPFEPPGTWKIISDLQEEGKLVAFIGDPLITEVPAKP
jgi:hypothetical protein